MNIKTKSTVDKTDLADSTASSSDQSQEELPAKTSKRKKKLLSKPMIWIRRIHLFSGLFMLPWVLLYGFTALLFNHPTYMPGAKTSIEHFKLDLSGQSHLPKAKDLAQLVVDWAQQTLNESSSDQKIELIRPELAAYTRQAVASFETDTETVSVILDINSSSGYLRKTLKQIDEPDSNAEETEQAAPALENSLRLSLQENPGIALKKGFAEVVKQYEYEKLNLRGIPTFEFHALVDGEPRVLRFSQGDRRRGRNQGSDDLLKPYKGVLSIVGQQPRELSLRSYLLRLHTAHGYPVQQNSRWFWAIAVDLMFASMVFWGLSGVFMWWQIKRTRKIGFVVLLLSAAVATWLAIGMHSQLVSG